MEVFLIYILKVLLLQTLLFGFYWFINRKSSGFQFNRYFLVATLILPFIIPFIKIPFNIFNSTANSEGLLDPWYLIEQSLPIVTINGSQEISNTTAWWIFMLVSIYIIVALPSTIRLLANYIRIKRLERTSTRKEYSPKGFLLHYVPSKILSFSFINRIFLSDQFPLKSSEKKTIITHEEYHLMELHSLDVILAEIVRIVCWFNPIVYLIQRNLKETHEYLADRHTIQQLGSTEYASLLRSFKWQEINMMLGNGYSSSSIKNRVQMIEQPVKNSPIFKIILSTLVALITVFLFACEESIPSLEQKKDGLEYEFSEADLQNEIQFWVTRLENAPGDFLEKYTTLQNRHPEYVYMPEIFGVNESDPRQVKMMEDRLKKGQRLGLLDFEIEVLRELDKDEIRSYYTPDQLMKRKFTTSYAIIRKVDRLKYMEHSKRMNIDDNSIHEDFDQMASFQGGMPALIKHLKENLRYPEIAYEKGIEDRLVMRFVVTKHGGLVYLNVDQLPTTQDEEVSLEFQKAAFMALHATEGKWKPAEKDGKYVMSKMTLPIEFKLDDKNAK